MKIEINKIKQIEGDNLSSSKLIEEASYHTNLSQHSYNKV